jgi:UDP-3-O-[3-hydroxymyristoyl] glucosamine N-acyltransferase
MPDMLLSGPAKMRGLWFFCAIGDNDAGAKIVPLAEGLGWKPGTLVHPSAFLDGTVDIGLRKIGPVSVICVDTKIGAHVIIDLRVSPGLVITNTCAALQGSSI